MWERNTLHVSGVCAWALEHGTEVVPRRAHLMCVRTSGGREPESCVFIHSWKRFGDITTCRDALPVILAQQTEYSAASLLLFRAHTACSDRLCACVPEILPQASGLLPEK